MLEDFYYTVLVFVSAFGLLQGSIYLTPETIAAEGYKAERHHAFTTDGYILEMHRIPFKRSAMDGDPSRPVVFIMHGITAASNVFIKLGPDYSIAYNLADAGFDVWMGNARGTKNSRRHISLDPDNPNHRLQFFDFSWEEIGMFDIPAMINYVLAVTGKQKLHYIGHSQGGTVFLVLNSMRPEYNEKFASVHLLAGVGYMEHFPHPLLRSVSLRCDSIYQRALNLGIVELFPPISSIMNRTTTDESEYRASDYCTGDPNMKDFCDEIGIHEIIKHNSIIDYLEENQSAGIALKQLVHFGQNIRDIRFRRWNYGPEQNIEVYGNEAPPEYNISLITANVTMHYTIADELLDEKDVLAMVDDMPNTIARKVDRDDFEHGDFTDDPDVKELVTDYIIDAIWDVERTTGSSANLVLSRILKIYLGLLLFNYIFG